jgi:hypothetical protein
VERIVDQEVGPADAEGALPPDPEAFAELVIAMVLALTGPFRVRTTARYVLFLEGMHDDEVRAPLLAGRVRFRALAEAALARYGSTAPSVAATAVMAAAEGMIMHRLAVDPDAEVGEAMRLVVRAAVAR